MRQGDAESRVRNPSDAGRQAAEPPMAQRRAPNRTACEDNARDGKMELIQAVMRRENMMAAHKRVVQNGGAPGVDGMTVEELMPYCRKHWERIREEVLSGTYQPQPVRKVEIPKPGGKGTRMLGIPTAMDRLIQQALHQVLQPIFDPTFSEGSFGFRPGRSAHDAVRQAREFVALGYRWVVDIDLEKFFDRVNHDVLMARVARRVKDKRVLLLIRRFLQAGIMEGGLVSHRTEGTPQGGPLSPLLSNILLDELDKELERRGRRFARYADDSNVYVQSEVAGERVMASLERFLWERLRLRINRDKSAVARPWERKFLGYTMTHNRKPRLKVAPESHKRLKERLKALWRRGRGQSLTTTIEQLNPIIRGWVAYYRMAEVKAGFPEQDSWIRRRLRCLLWRQWKKPHTRLKELRRRGVDVSRSHAGSMNSRGPWWNAGSSHMNQAVPNAKLQEMGLVNCQEEHQRLARSR